MSGGSDEADNSLERRRDKVGQLLQKSYTKGELALKHALGLGAAQNVVPIAQPTTNGPPRPVEVGWHPVGGFAGKWFAEKTGLGKMITDKINEYPDPTQHWAVLVGGYAHQLWMDENFHVIYTNAVRDPNEWRTFQVGETCFNDDALRRTGEAVIHQLRSTRPGYNLISNNCQTYVLQLLDAIKVSQVKEFGTTLAVYQRLFGSGKVADLFVEGDENPLSDGAPGESIVTAPVEGQELGVIGGTADNSLLYHHPEALLHQHQETGGGSMQQNSILFAQQVMNANTTQLNAKDEMQRDTDKETLEDPSEGSWRKKTNSFLSRFQK